MIRPLQITRRNVPARHRRSWGGSVLEAAFIVPILVSLAFGMAEFSYFFFVKHTLEGAAREGARTAITPQATNTGAGSFSVTQAVQNALSAAGVSTNSVSIAITDTGGASINVNGYTSGLPVQVKCTANWSAVGVHPLGIIPNSKQVIGVCVMRKEG